ncbi:4324_t:CDS:1, partial [Ambispora gerdemannii]
MVIEPLNSLFLQFCSKTSGMHPVSNSDRNGSPDFLSPPAKPYGEIFHLEALGSFYHGVRQKIYLVQANENKTDERKTTLNKVH